MLTTEAAVLAEVFSVGFGRTAEDIARHLPDRTSADVTRCLRRFAGNHRVMTWTVEDGNTYYCRPTTWT